MAHDKWESDAVHRFIQWMSDSGQGNWRVSGEEIVVDERNRNFDYELSCDGQQLIALELFRLIESQEQLAAERFWAQISNAITAELRKRGVKGFTIRSTRFKVPKNQINEFVQKQADAIERAIAEHPNEKDEFKVGMFDIQQLDDFNDVSMYWIGGAAQINPPRTALVQLEQLLPHKNQQLAITGKRRVVFVVNWARIVGPADVVEACATMDFGPYNNIDQIYFEVSDGAIELVYDRNVYRALAQVPEAHFQIEISPLFLLTLASRLARKDLVAFGIVRHITSQCGSAEWLDPLSRSELVSYGEDFLARGDFEGARWIAETLENDPDPEIREDDAHHKISRGEDVIFIYSVRGRLCWLMYKIICLPVTAYYEHIVTTLERYAGQENLYVRLQATVPLQGLAQRRLATQQDGTRFMSDGLAQRVKALAFKMLRENKAFPAIVESLSIVFSFIRAINAREAHEVIETLCAISESDSVDNLAVLLAYFALFRSEHNAELGPFDSAPFKEKLRSTIKAGSPRLRARLTNQFHVMVARKELSSEIAADYLFIGLSGDYNHVLNLHLYQCTSFIADTRPNLAFELLKRAVEKEVQALKAGTRQDVWHGREYRQTVEKIAQSEQRAVLETLPVLMRGFERHILSVD